MLNPDRAATIPGILNVSAANFWPETIAAASFPNSTPILDSTLRKTYFTAGNTTTLAGFIRIAEALVELGVTDTCLNVTWSGDTDPTPQDWALMTAILGADLPLRVNVWSDVLLGNGRDPLPIDPRDGLRRLVDAGARYIAPGIVPAPDADSGLRQRDQLDEHFALATELGVVTTITLAQVGLRDFDELVRVSAHAARAGAVRLDLMDSTSSLSPQAMSQFVRRFRAGIASDVAITMHAHDEFGLATANALAAVAEGAAPDVSVNGMSYRAGFAPLEEVVLALEVLHGVDTGIHLDRIAATSRIVARESGLPVPQLKPLTGEFAHLKHMPGDAALAISQGDRAFPPISHGLVPPVMGAEVTWVWGAASSIAQTRALASACGYELSSDQLRIVRQALDAEVSAIASYPRWLSPSQARAALERAVLNLDREDAVRSVSDVVDAAVSDPTVAGALCAALGADRYAAATTRLDVAAAIERTIEALSMGQLIDSLTHFRRFGDDTGGGRPDLSDAEEQALRDSPEPHQLRLRELAARYEEHFGFRAVVDASGMTAGEIEALLADALSSSATAELVRTRASVTSILTRRMHALLAPEESLRDR